MVLLWVDPGCGRVCLVVCLGGCFNVFGGLGFLGGLLSV